MKTKTFTCGDESYSYNFVHQQRKTLSLTVYPDKNIVVKVPASVSQDRVDHFLRRKYAWLSKQIRYFKNNKHNLRKKEYVSGESFMYLGRQYKLMVRRAEKNRVRLDKSTLWVYANANGNLSAQSQKVLNDWYKNEAEKLLLERFEESLSDFDYPKKPALKLRTMRTRWGSCSKKGSISLNLKLIHAPLHCIDYVIMHELCHLIEHNHSAKYYKLMDGMMPDWRDRKKRLALASVL